LRRIAHVGRVRRDECGRDLDERIDELRCRPFGIERHDDRCAVGSARLDASRCARAGKSRQNVCVCERVGDGDGAGKYHGFCLVRKGVSEVRRARVIAVGRNAAWIVFGDETEPRLANFRKRARHPMLVPGDIVEAAPQDDPDHLVVDTVVPRTFALERRTGGGRLKTMAANIDTLAIVAALTDPPIRLALIDRLIAFAVLHDLEPALILTKPDLAGEPAAQAVADMYRRIAVSVLILQPKTGRGIDELRALIAARSAMLIGQSGVGKSSIFRALGGVGPVGELTRFGRGRQTTTSARLFRMGDGFLIDSPGIGEFTLDAMPAIELAALFVEMRGPARQCRFSDCRHLSEPGCAVRAAAEAGTIAPSRYESYREILGELPG
jgi:ribosome biogenesis GTPase